MLFGGVVFGVVIVLLVVLVVAVHECVQCLAGVGLFHEVFADEHGVDALLSEPLDVFVCADA